jgi:hypothetical protein
VPENKSLCVDQAQKLNIYRSLANATTELIWVEAQVDELGIVLKEKACLCGDNMGATYLSVNPVFHVRTK